MNANDTLKQHNCTDNYYGYTSGMVITDGAKALADDYEAYWLLDVISSYQDTQPFRSQDFQVWELKKLPGDTPVVTCKDGNGKLLVRQDIEYTNFKATTATLWVEGKVILLPSEH